MKYGLALFLFLTSALYAVPLQHTIAEGETLYSLSRRYNIPVDLITKANSIQDVSNLRIGQILIMPGVHQVVAGDTIYSLSRRYNVDQDELLRINGLSSPESLRIGSLLLISEDSQGQRPVSNESLITEGESLQNQNDPRPPGTPITLVNNTNNSTYTNQSRSVDPYATMVDYLDGVRLSSDAYYLHLEGARGGFWAPLAGKVVYIGRHRNLGLILLLEVEENKLLGIRGVDEFVVKEGQMVRKGAELGRIQQGGGSAALFAYNKGNPWKIEEALAFWKF
jgi:LysM repeat protein